MVSAANSTAIGNNSHVAASANDAVAIGADSSVDAEGGTALGQGATVVAEGAVAIGQGVLADEANTVSVGAADNRRRVTNVAAGIAATDAANLGQLESGDATTLAASRTYTDGRSAQTLASANGYTDATATRTLHSANAYTDTRFTTLQDDFSRMRGQVDTRFNEQEHRIDQMGAMTAAMVNMATSAAGINTVNRVGVGVGFQNGAAALSLGYQRALSDRATVTLGGAFSGDDGSVGAGIGFGW